MTHNTIKTFDVNDVWLAIIMEKTEEKKEWLYWVTESKELEA